MHDYFSQLPNSEWGIMKNALVISMLQLFPRVWRRLHMFESLFFNTTRLDYTMLLLFTLSYTGTEKCLAEIP